jgi:hypothetical protein
MARRMETRSVHGWVVSRGTMFDRTLGELLVLKRDSELEVLAGATEVCGFPTILTERLVELRLAIGGETLPE